jgi:hypothetical protein
MSKLFSRPLPIGKTVFYTFSERLEWLDGGQIIGPTVKVQDNAATVGVVTTDGKVIQVELTGVTAGRFEVHFNYSVNNGQSYCYSGFVDIVEC